MSKEFSNKKYDHSKALGKHVTELNQLITQGLQSDEVSDFSNYFNQVIMGMVSLDAMLDPFKDDEWDEIFQDFNPNTMSMAQKMSFVKNSLRKYYNLMNDKGLFYVTYSSDRMGSKDKTSDEKMGVPKN
jgi:hypothetical protein